jgi:hypothetical protein
LIDIEVLFAYISELDTNLKQTPRKEYKGEEDLTLRVIRNSYVGVYNATVLVYEYLECPQI